MQKTPVFWDEQFGKAVKTAFSSSGRFFWRRMYIQQSILISYSLSGLEQKTFHLLCKKFEPELFTLHSSWPTEHFAEKRTFVWSKSLITFGHWGEKFRSFPHFFAYLWKLHSMCPKELFELDNDLSIGAGGWTKHFQSTGRKFSENLSKKQRLLRKNILEGLFSRRRARIEEKLLETSYNERNLLDFKRNAFL